MEAMRCSRTWGSWARMVPSRVARPAMTLGAPPAAKRPTVTTLGCEGSTSRLTMVWMDMTSRLPTTMASTLSWGRAPWASWPRISMWKVSVLALTVPSVTMSTPAS